MVFSEYAGYELAALVGVPVPEHALCTVAGELHFASLKMPYRFAPENLLNGPAENVEMLGATAALDVWLANDDRNVGNIVAARGDEVGRVRLHAIDFESAQALRGVKDQFSVMAAPVRSMMPKEPLGAICRRQPLPMLTCERIASSGSALEDIISRWHAEMLLPRIEWSDRACTILRQRSEMIQTLVEEAWR